MRSLNLSLRCYIRNFPVHIEYVFLCWLCVQSLCGGVCVYVWACSLMTSYTLFMFSFAGERVLVRDR
jgi:hypothetical protein